MKRSLTLTLLLATMLAVAACGGGADQSEQAVPTEPRTQEASNPASITEEAAQEETGREEAPAESEAAEGEQRATSEQENSPGLSVTTIEGEEVGIGQGEVTALFFMAGW